jgi:hypothetical protein
MCPGPDSSRACAKPIEGPSGRLCRWRDSAHIIQPQSDATGLSRAGWTDPEFFEKMAGWRPHSTLTELSPSRDQRTEIFTPKPPKSGKTVGELLRCSAPLRATGLDHAAHKDTSWSRQENSFQSSSIPMFVRSLTSGGGCFTKFTSRRRLRSTSLGGEYGAIGVCPIRCRLGGQQRDADEF